MTWKATRKFNTDPRHRKLVRESGGIGTMEDAKTTWTTEMHEEIHDVFNDWDVIIQWKTIEEMPQIRDVLVIQQS
jgi:hypothetical protein